MEKSGSLQNPTNFASPRLRWRQVAVAPLFPGDGGGGGNAPDWVAALEAAGASNARSLLYLAGEPATRESFSFMVDRHAVSMHSDRKRSPPYIS